MKEDCKRTQLMP